MLFLFSRQNQQAIMVCIYSYLNTIVMFKNFTLLVIFSLGMFSFAFAQGEHNHRTCGMQHHMEVMMQDHEFAAAHMEKLARLEAYSAANNGERMACPNPVILPMAVHFQGISSPNQSCLIAMAERQIQILNEDYGGYNADITNWTNGSAANFPGVSNAETCVQFCLATQNHPAGYGLVEGQPAITFNTTSGDFVGAFSGYINIYVRNAGGGILGYSPLGGSGNGDGVVIDDNAFSNSPGCGQVSPGAPYNGGRTLTHELGHYLLLNHIWGDGGCGADDGVADTPIAGASNGGCPSASQTSCGSLDMHMNYMDYTNDACMYMFTAGQATRMENYVAANLTNVSSNYNSVCVSTPTAPTAGIGTSLTSGCSPLAVNFTDQSGGIPTSWSWSFPGGTPSSSTAQNPGAITYSTPGVYTATLTATNAQGSDVTTVSIDAQTCTNCNDLNHMAGGTPTLIDATSLGGSSGYVGGHNSFGDAAKAEFFNDYGTANVITSVSYNFGIATGSGDVEFTIWADAGGSPGAEIATATVPVSAIIADVNAGSRTMVDFNTPITGNFYAGFKLAATNEIAAYTTPDGTVNPTTAWELWGDGSWHPFNDYTNSNTTWEIDVALDIRPEVCEATTPVQEIEGLTSMSLYPNPVTSELNLEFISEQNLEVSIDVYDTMGRKVYSSNGFNINGIVNKTVNTSNFSSGTYFIRVNSEGAIATHKFVKL